MAGFESSLSVSGEIKDPKRKIPLAILLGGILAFSIYVLVQIVTQGVLGTEMSIYKDAPLAGIANRIAGTTGVTILLFAAAISGLGSVNGDVLASPRVLFAGAKDGLFPKFLGRVHPKFATPYLAVITFAIGIFVFAVSGGFKQLAILASGIASDLSRSCFSLAKIENEKRSECRKVLQSSRWIACSHYCNYSDPLCTFKSKSAGIDFNSCFYTCHLFNLHSNEKIQTKTSLND
ncbi:MAG: APC family permease [Bacteroidetes bacterium]|nr:APC family permease [Bacteroidota bacterium]